MEQEEKTEETTETVDFGTNWLVVDDKGSEEIESPTQSF